MDKVAYEWDVETFDVYCDIIDHNHGDTLAELKAYFKFPVEDGLQNRIVLVRDVWNDHAGVIDRQWAYLENTDENGWQMPAEFDSGASVPKRFAKEFDKNRAWAITK